MTSDWSGHCGWGCRGPRRSPQSANQRPDVQQRRRADALSIAVHLAGTGRRLVGSFSDQRTLGGAASPIMLIQEFAVQQPKYTCPAVVPQAIGDLEPFHATVSRCCPATMLLTRMPDGRRTLFGALFDCRRQHRWLSMTAVARSHQRRCKESGTEHKTSLGHGTGNAMK